MSDHGQVHSRLARWVLAAFLLTFAIARILVLLIMSRRIPDFFLFVGQTHVHHLNYGIFLLVTVGAWLLLFPPEASGRRNAAIAYGVGLGLTFDEFGMWLHLGGSYWQRTSYDAVVVVAVVLALLSFGSDLRKFRMRDWLWFLAILFSILVAGYLTAERLQQLSPELHKIEDAFPH